MLPANAASALGLGPPRILVDSPTSRLSKRITWKPWSASRRQNSGSQWMSWKPEPHDQQQRRVGGVAEGVVLEGDSVADLGLGRP